MGELRITIYDLMALPRRVQTSAAAFNRKS
jgi:hypothetical protein